MSSQYARYPNLNQIVLYGSVTSFPALGNVNGNLALALDTSTLYEWNGTSWVAIATPGAAIALDGLNGDGTATGPGVAPLTLATVNSNVGSFGTASQVGSFTVNGKGLITAASNTPIQIAESQVTNLVSDLAGKQSTLTFGSISTSTTGLTIGSGSNSTVGPNVTVNVQTASGSQPGLLSAADWTTFNGKQAAGSYITALTGDGSASGPGSAALTLATVNSNVGSFGSSTAIPSFTVNGKGLITAASTNAVIAPAGTLSGTTLNSSVVSSSLTSIGTITSGVWNGTQLTNPYIPSLPVNQHWYVDNTRTDTYTADGSFQRPYTTIMGAVNQIIALALNSPTHIDEIDIISPSTYVENVTFNNSALQAIILNGNNWATITPASGDAINSSSNNTQLGLLWINGFASISQITLTGDVNGTNFAAVSTGGAMLTNTTVLGDSSFSNMGEIQAFNCPMVGTTFYQNIITGQFTSCTSLGALTLNHNNGANKPAGLGASGTTLIYQNGVAGTATTTLGTSLQYRSGMRVGTSSQTMSISGDLTDYAATYRGNITINSGGTWEPYASSYDGTLTNNGTITLHGRVEAKPFVGDSGSGGSVGGVPAPASGDSAAGKVLLAGGTWGLPGSTGITNQSAVTGTTVSDALNNLNTQSSEILLTAIKNGGAVTANTEIPTWTTVVKDTNSAFNSSTGTYTVPVAGDYEVEFHADTTALTPTAQIYHNGVLVQTGINSLTRTFVTTVIPNCAVNDTIWVALDTTATIAATNTDTILNINAVAGVPTGVVNARYHGATATVTGSLSNVSWTTKDFDSNNALSGATYTIPSPGKYEIRASVGVTATTVAAGNTQLLTLNKNGSEIFRNTFISGAATQKPAVLVINDLFQFATNDTVTVQVSSASTTPSISASNTQNVFSINKVSI